MQQEDENSSCRWRLRAKGRDQLQKDWNFEECEEECSSQVRWKIELDVCLLLLMMLYAVTFTHKDVQKWASRSNTLRRRVREFESRWRLLNMTQIWFCYFRLIWKIVEYLFFSVTFYVIRLYLNRLPLLSLLKLGNLLIV